MEWLPYVDEHHVALDAPAERVWDAVLDTLRTAFGRPGAPAARLLGCEPATGSPSFTGAVGDALPGFRIAGADPGRHLVLEGRHRFSRYRLELVFDGTTLRAITHATFPGLAGRAYRSAVIGSGAHRITTRRLLRTMARRTAPARL